MLAAPFADNATFDASLLVRVIKTSAGAGDDKITGNGTEVKPGWAITLAGRTIPFTTNVLAVALETVGTFELAVIVVEPGARPVIGTSTLLAFAGNVTVSGTVAAPVFDELKLITKLVGAATDKLKATFCVAPVVTVVVPAGKLIVAPTVTVGLTGIGMYPTADTVIVAVPKFTPLTWGCVAGVVAPPAIKTDGVTVAVDGSLLLRVTVTPPAGAAGDRLSVNVADWFGPTVVIEGTVMMPGSGTVTATEADVTFGALLLAVMFVAPGATAANGTLTVVVLAWKLT